MVKFIGVDYGTSMLKAAAVDSSPDEPSLLVLADGDTFLPVAVQFRTSVNEFLSGQPAYACRRSRSYQVATDFRDRLIDPRSMLQLSGKSYDSVAIQRPFFQQLRGQIQSLAPDVDTIAVAVPDHWSEETWSLPIALHRAGWRPRLFVREWVSVLAMHDIPADQVVLLSLGFGLARATLCRRTGTGWQQLETRTNGSISGAALRQRIVDSLAEEVIRETRRDPREDPDADQLLTDAIESVLRQLQRSPEALLELEIGSRRFSRNFGRNQLTSLVTADAENSFKSELLRLVSANPTDPESPSTLARLRLRPMEHVIMHRDITVR